MEKVIMDLPVILLALGIFWRIKLVPEGDTDSFLSLSQTGAVKGILALGIVFHHVSRQTQGGWLLSPFQHFGGMILCMFFFYSGYGVQKKNLADPGYEKRFLKNRLLSVLVPYLTVTLIYKLIYRVPASEVFAGFFNGNSIVRFSWYVHHILTFYIAFYLFMRLLGQRKLPMALVMSLAAVLWVAYTMSHWYPTNWYGTSHILVLGIIWANWEEPLTKWLAERRRVKMLLLTAVFLFFYAVSRNRGGIPELLLKDVMYVCFVMMVLGVLMKVQFGSPVLSFLGSISFELYLFHGLVMNLLAQWNCPDSWFCLAVPAISIVCAYLSHLVFSKILSLLR